MPHYLVNTFQYRTIKVSTIALKIHAGNTIRLSRCLGQWWAVGMSFLSLRGPTYT